MLHAYGKELSQVMIQSEAVHL